VDLLGRQQREALAKVEAQLAADPREAARRIAAEMGA
jgi:hypothetical protein